MSGPKDLAELFKTGEANVLKGFHIFDVRDTDPTVDHVVAIVDDGKNTYTGIVLLRAPDVGAFKAYLKANKGTDGIKGRFTRYANRVRDEHGRETDEETDVEVVLSPVVGAQSQPADEPNTGEAGEAPKKKSK